MKIVFCWLAFILLLTGCGQGKPSVTLYTDMDRRIIEPLIQQFQQEKKITVTVVYADPQSVQQGTGLSGRLLAESGSPKADVYWAASPLGMESLVKNGLVQPVGGRAFAETAPGFRDIKGAWTGLTGRVRVLVYNKSLAQNRLPKSIAALSRPEWKGRVAFADPRSNGDAKYHLLTYFAAYGEEVGGRLVEAMKSNQIQLLPTETAVVEAVANGSADWGVTDSDAATAAVLAKKPVDYLVPDQEPFSTSDALGQSRGSGVPTLGVPALPCPVSLVGSITNNIELQKFIEFIFAPQIALKISETDPTLLMTRAGAKEDKPGKAGGKLVHADKLEFTTLGMSNLEAVRPPLTLALSHVLGDAPNAP